MTTQDPAISHLHPKAAIALGWPINEKLRLINEDIFVSYPIATMAIEQILWQTELPSGRSSTMLVGGPGMGKLHIYREVCSRLQINSNEQGDCKEARPILYISLAGIKTLSDFIHRILYSMNAPLMNARSNEDQVSRILRLLRLSGVLINSAG